MPTIDYRNAEGQRVSGVTTIISTNLGWNKQALMYWANQVGQQGKNHRDVSGAAADAGTIAHFMIECDIKGNKPDTSKYPPELVSKAETAYLNFLEWKDIVNFKVVHTEIHLISERYQYGLTPDCIALIKGKLALFDWKTSNGVYEDMLIQLAAYRVGWEENHPDKPLEGGFHLLKISKETASFSYHYWQDLSEAWEVFKNLLDIHKLHKGLKALSK